ncbi:O-acetyl-ADP-ribose deacetylase macrod1 [Geranomyces variabilis]|nr:O-acetyl-ADP-ribose deacetylase macrod1 [Geranomyces variabilis]
MSSWSSWSSARKPHAPTKASAVKTLKQLYTRNPDFADTAYRNFLDNPGARDIEPNDAINDKIALWQGDITTLEIDAIVNAANESLLGGGGVDGAIHSAAGRGLYQECKTLDGCRTGSAKLTGGHDLPAKHIIHAVGPIGYKPKLLASCYWKSLQLCDEHKLKEIAFCCISTGIFGFPNDAAAQIAMANVRQYLERPDTQIERVLFVIFLQKDKAIYLDHVGRFFPPVLAPEADETSDVPHKRKASASSDEGDTGASNARGGWHAPMALPNSDKDVSGSGVENNFAELPTAPRAEVDHLSTEGTAAPPERTQNHEDADEGVWQHIARV